MQFKELDEKGYKRVCDFIAERATGVTTDKEGAAIMRNGVRLYFMFGMLHQVIIEKDFADFCMGSRPFCNIRVALKVDNWNELIDLYKATMKKGAIMKTKETVIVAKRSLTLLNLDTVEGRNIALEGIDDFCLNCSVLSEKRCERCKVRSIADRLNATA